jgi:SNF2 family DNA or RNA helicase
MTLCSDWKSDKSHNPITKRKVNQDSVVYKQLDTVCENQREVCKRYSKDKTRNPLTNRVLGETSRVRRLLETLCSKKETAAAKREAERRDEYIDDHLLTQSPLQCTEYKTVQLKKHQKHVCNYIKNNKTRGLVLFHSVGSGKTITAITIIRCILQNDSDQKVFVVTPTSLVDNFGKEVEKVGVRFGSNVNVYSHGTLTRKIAKEGAEFCRDSVIIVDEAHNFKTKVQNGEGKRVKLMMRGTAAARQVFLLTATPVQNRPSEFVNLYAMVSKREHEISKLYRTFDEASPSKLARMLKNKISYFKNSSTEDYPSVTYHDIEFRMTKRYYKMYMEVEQDQSDLFRNVWNTSNMTVFLNGVRRAVNTIDGRITTPKAEWAIDHIKKCVAAGKKVVMYSTWLRSGLELIQSRLDDAGVDWVEVNGRMSKRQRTLAVNQYNRDEKLVMFVSSAGAEGLDLKGTRSIIILEPHWNNEKIKQVVGRGVRYQSHSHLPPRQRHVDIYNLILKKPRKYQDDDLASADEMLMKMSHEKEDVILQFYNILIKASI